MCDLRRKEKAANAASGQEGDVSDEPDRHAVGAGALPCGALPCGAAWPGWGEWALLKPGSLRSLRFVPSGPGSGFLLLPLPVSSLCFPVFNKDFFQKNWCSRSVWLACLLCWRRGEGNVFLGDGAGQPGLVWWRGEEGRECVLAHLLFPGSRRSYCSFPRGVLCTRYVKGSKLERA